MVDGARGGIAAIEGIGTAASSGGMRGAMMMVAMMMVAMIAGATGVEAGI